MAALFDHYVIVDWSAASRPKRGRDSIWICHRFPDGERVDNPPTRAEARALLARSLAAAMARGERVLLGFDFPFGYPAGFADRLGLKGPAWRAVWNEIAGRIEDKPNNNNNRFDVANDFNRRISDGVFPAFPFWGRPVRMTAEFLKPKHHRSHESGALAEKRLIDKWMKGAQPCWKLLGAGSVGSQTLTGIPVVWALRNDRRWRHSARIWPFETGLRPPKEAQIVFAEVWPSWWDWKATRDPSEVNDSAQVRHVARLFAARDRAGTLTAMFFGGRSLTPTERRVAEREEAWTLGVTAPRRAARKSKGGGSERSAKPTSPSQRFAPGPSLSPLKGGEGKEKGGDYTYLRDPAAIYRRSFALVREEADLTRFPASLRPLAVRLAHAAGDTAILGQLAWSRGAAAAGRRALAAGAAILADSEMVASGIARQRLPQGNPVICTLRDPAIPGLAAAQGTTRSAAAVELWRPHLAGAVVAIGSAPTALFRLLELIAAGGAMPALVLGFPVGFVGAAEAKEALTRFGGGLRYVTLAGRRGGSALAAAAVNALSGGRPG